LGLEKIITRSPTIAAVLAVSFLGVLDPALAVSSGGHGGLTLAQLSTMNAVKVSDLVVKAGVKRQFDSSKQHTRSISKVSFQSSGREGVAIVDLLKATPAPLSQVFAAAHHRSHSEKALQLILGHETVKAPLSIALTLPRTVKASPSGSKKADLQPVTGITPDHLSFTAQATPGLPKAIPHKKSEAPTRTTSAQKIQELLATTPVHESLSSALLLKIEREGQGFHISPRSLVFPQTGRVAKIEWSQEASDLSLFVRDQAIVSLDQTKGQLTAHKRGVTELYAVSQGKMYIVPITVEDGASQWDLKVPDALLSLEGIFRGDALGAASSASFKAPESSVPSSSLSLRDSVAQTEKTLADAAQASREITLDRSAVLYGTLSLQVIDDRSSPVDGKIYPVPNIDVRLVGTELKARTDATGHVTIRDVPLGSHFQVRLDDPNAALRPSLVEVEAQAGVARVRMLRSFVFEALQNIIQSAQNTNLGSYCGSVVAAEPKGTPQQDIQISIDAPHEGPFYFNRYGFPDRAQAATGPDGRFCFLNVATGPAALSMTHSNRYVETVTVPIYGGRHVDEDLVLGRDKTLRTRLVAMPSAHEQLSGDQSGGVRYSPIDMVDLIPLGSDDPMTQVASGVVQTQDEIPIVSGKVRAISRAAEFEPVLYQYKEGARQPVTPLIPRGFVEDLALYAQVSHDPEQGSVLVEFGHPKGLDDSVNMRLLDQYGRDVGDGWYFSDQPMTRAMFFNVNPGIYTILAETKDRYWLAADSVYVYNETVSYLNLGSELRYRALRKREDDGR
jgi:hypothetical protein